MSASEAVTCGACGNAMWTTEAAVPGSSPITRIRERIEDLQGQRLRYIAYQADRVREGDNHAVWDSAIDINLCDYEIKGLEFAMKALGVEP